MPPTQTVNVMTSPVFYSSSLESGSSQQQQQRLADADHASWASALSSSQAPPPGGGPDGAGWVNVTLDPLLDEATWQEEAHWMSFHHAIQSLVVSCQALERNKAANPPTSSSTTSHNTTLPSPESPMESHNSGGDDNHTGSSSHSMAARQLLTEAAPPLPVVETTVHRHVVSAPTSVEDATLQTRMALAQADQDEWEIMGMPSDTS